MKKRRVIMSTLAVLPLYLFTLLFIVGPLALMLILSFSERDGWGYSAAFTFANYAEVLSGMYLETFAESLKLAVISTALVILIGYPFGLTAARLPKSQSRFIHTMQVIPYWVNSLLRLYGWIIIFRANGLLDRFLMLVGITEKPLKLLYTYPAVIVGMVYVLMPFMFTSVYQVASKLDITLVEASRDLGAGKVKSFLTVVLPLTASGLGTGIVLTFIPSMGLFFIASILGGNKVVLVGSLIEELLMKSHNKPAAAALSVLLMLLTAVVCAIILRNPRRDR